MPVAPGISRSRAILVSAVVDRSFRVERSRVSVGGGPPSRPTAAGEPSRLGAATADPVVTAVPLSLALRLSSTVDPVLRQCPPKMASPVLSTVLRAPRDDAGV